jgi:plastocyanin
MKRSLLLALVVAALAGCGGKSATTTHRGASPSASGKTVQVKESEFKLAPAKITIASPGTVTFEATNAGKVDHALELEGNGVEEETDTISPGSSAKLTVDLSKAGTYELYCPIDDHRGMGMQATVVVGGGGGGGGGGTTTNGTTGTTSTSGGYGY